MNRIMWTHTSTADYRSYYGPGIRPMMETRHPEGMILLSELSRAKLAARRAYARWHDVPLQDVTASPVYNTGMTSVDHVNAYVAGPECGAQLDWKGATCARPADHKGACDTYSD